MSLAYPSAPAARTIRWLDGVLLLWIAVWIVYGVAVHRQIENLSTVSATLVKTGEAVDATSSALGPLASLPFVGKQIDSLQARIHDVAQSAIESGRVSGEGVDRLALELGLAIALIPTIPLLALYAPMRVARVREVRAIRSELRRAGDDPRFREFLARRAAENLPYHRLREVSEEPWRDLEAGKHDALARAELRRLGFRRAT